MLLPPYELAFHVESIDETSADMSDYLRWNTQMPARLTEFAILMSARHWNSHWIWRGHYRAAVMGGLDPKVGADLATGNPAVLIRALKERTDQYKANQRRLGLLDRESR